MQNRPQPPQCIGSVRNDRSHPSVGLTLQSPKPALQIDRVQLPMMHRRVAFGVAGHDIPQPLQWSGSHRGSTHPTTQASSGGPHDVWHWPIAQTEPGAHAMPHMPQFSRSVASVTHWPWHTAWFIAQLGAQAPETQPLPGAQTMPHMPQFKTSLMVSTQNGPQAVVVGGQLTPQFPARHARPGGQAMPHAPQLALS